MEAAQGGDGEALDALLRQYQPQIFRFGMKMCRDPEDAQDVLQETLLAAARTLHGFRGASSLSTWLYTIARSFCIKSAASQCLRSGSPVAGIGGAAGASSP